MDKDRLTLPRLADVGRHRPSQPQHDPIPPVSSHHPSSSAAPSAPSAPPASSARPLLHHLPPAAQLTRQPYTTPHRQQPPLRPQFFEAQPSSPLHILHPPQHPQPPQPTNAPSSTTAPLPISPMPTRQSSTSVPLPERSPTAAIAKPKKLHREVEQKRRMRMSEQIIELRKWVCDPNAGKTDKVSVLQEAVAFVKQASTRIDELRAALEHSQTECAHLRSLLETSQPPVIHPQPPHPTPAGLATRAPPRMQNLIPATAAAAAAAAAASSRSGAELSHTTRMDMVTPVYQQPRPYMSVPMPSAMRPGGGPGMTPPNFAVNAPLPTSAHPQPWDNTSAFSRNPNPPVDASAAHTHPPQRLVGAAHFGGHHDGSIPPRDMVHTPTTTPAPVYSSHGMRQQSSHASRSQSQSHGEESSTYRSERSTDKQ